ncbi:MAG TPA: WHG domain-containing protein, partial [Chloroflexota bacterium]|nr:WHG domain-containing protein [Chloroflexota bacterium]
MAVRAGLDRDTVVRAAAKLADTEGLEVVTLARLAALLGVRPPSLYNHVAGQEGLRRELALYGLSDLAKRMGQAAIGKSGDHALVAIAHAYRDFAREHPGVHAVCQRAPDPDDPEWVAIGQEVVGIMLAVLAGYSLTGDDALHAVRALRSIVYGFASLEAAGGFGLPLDLDESFRRLLQMFIAGLHQQHAGARRT